MEYTAEFIYDKSETGRRIRSLREQKKITCEEMAQKLGRTEKEFRDIEQGLCSVSLHTALKIAAFFDLTLDELIEGDSHEADAQIQPTGEEEKILSLLARSDPRQRTEALKLVQEYLLDGIE